MKIVGPTSRVARWELGRCTSANDTEYIYVPLPKCASRYTTQILQYMCGWNEFPRDNFILNTKLAEKKKIVVLRDPLSRWYSGIVQHFHMQQLDMVEENMHYVVNQLAPDIHTELQAKYLEGLDTENCVFFLLDDTYKETLKHFIINVLNKNYTFWNKNGQDNQYTQGDQLLWYNATEEKLHKKLHMIELKKFMESCPDYIIRLQEYLKPDYDLINNVEFYKHV